MKPVLIMTFTVPLSSDSILDQSVTLATLASARDALVAALPEGATHSERTVKTGRVETKPRQRRVPRAMPDAQAAE